MTTAEIYNTITEIMNGVIFDAEVSDDKLFHEFVVRIAKVLHLDKEPAHMYACRALRPYVWLAEKDKQMVLATGSKYARRLKALVDGRFEGNIHGGGC